MRDYLDEFKNASVNVKYEYFDSDKRNQKDLPTFNAFNNSYLGVFNDTTDPAETSLVVRNIRQLDLRFEL